MTVGSQTSAELIAEARRWPDDMGEGRTLNQLADALEAAEEAPCHHQNTAYLRMMEERDAAIQRAEEAEREMHARELHHFEEEERAAGLAAVIEKVEDFVTRHYLDTQMGRAVLTELSTPLGDARREHDAALIEGLADEVKAQADAIKTAQLEANQGYLPLNIVAILGGYGRVDGILREKARQKREEQAR